MRMERNGSGFRPRGTAWVAVAALVGLGMAGLGGIGLAAMAAEPLPISDPSSVSDPAALSLQERIDQAEPGAVITLAPGSYRGPLRITKSLTLEGEREADGAHAAVIDAGGAGTVITIKGDGVTLAGLRLVNSGHSHNDIDAGVHIKGNYNIVRDTVIEDCLFGIDLEQSNNNILKRNRIVSKDISLGLRGDAVRLWYSFGNKVTDNTVTDSRDVVVWYSANNTIADNRISQGRYGIHFMYSKYNLIEGNDFFNNSVGIFLMYSDDVVVRNNRIIHAQGAAGMGVGLKETSNTDIIGNQILYSGTGLYLDVSPFQPDTTNRIFGNTIAYSRIGVLFLNDWHGNHFRDNRFLDNIRQVSVNEYAGATRHVWEENYWDDYEGFDRDGDGFGDSSYAPKVYADRVWMDVPDAAFFMGTPLLSTLDFLERLAPFTDPLVMLVDERPRFSRAFEAAPYEPNRDSPDNEGEGEGEEGLPGGEDALGADGRPLGFTDAYEADTDTTGAHEVDPFGLNNPTIGTLAE